MTNTTPRLAEPDKTKNAIFRGVFHISSAQFTSEHCFCCASMPVLSARKLLLESLQKEIHWFQKEQEFKLLLGEDPLNDEDLLFEADVTERFNNLSSQRFHQRTRIYCRGNAWEIFKEDLI